MFLNSFSTSEPTEELGIQEHNGVKGCSTGCHIKNSCRVLQNFSIGFFSFVLESKYSVPRN